MMRPGLLTGFGPTEGGGPPPATGSEAYDLRAHLESLGWPAWLNAAPSEEEPPPFFVAYRTGRQRLTNESVEYDYAIACVGESFAQAMQLADAVRDYEGWPFPLIYITDKDEYAGPQDGGDVTHVLTVNVQFQAP